MFFWEKLCRAHEIISRVIARRKDRSLRNIIQFIYFSDKKKCIKYYYCQPPFAASKSYNPHDVGPGSRMQLLYTVYLNVYECVYVYNSYTFT